MGFCCPCLANKEAQNRKSFVPGFQKPGSPVLYLGPPGPALKAPPASFWLHLEGHSAPLQVGTRRPATAAGWVCAQGWPQASSPWLFPMYCLVQVLLSHRPRHLHSGVTEWDVWRAEEELQRGALESKTRHFLHIRHGVCSGCCCWK